MMLLARLTRFANRWSFGRRGTYDVTNRLGDGMRPGREDYAVVLHHDPEEAEPVLDWSDAHGGWRPLGHVGYESAHYSPRIVGRCGQDSEILTWKVHS